MEDHTAPKCVVCRETTSIDAGFFPNMWEATVKQRVCCSKACVETFNADIHWIPSTLPLPTEKESALIAEASRRVAKGDSLPPLVRELLSAGVQVSGVEHFLRMLQARHQYHQEIAASATVVSGVGRLLTHGPLSALLSLFRSSSEASSQEVEVLAIVDNAHLDIHSWCEAWGLPLSAGGRTPRQDSGSPKATHADSGPISDEVLAAATDEQLQRIAEGEAPDVVLGR